MFTTGDLNPHTFLYPSLLFYINALVYIPYYLLGKLTGVFHTRNNILPVIQLVMGVTQAQMPTTVLLGRVITICFGVGTVWLVYFVGKQLTGRTAVGLLASLMVAVSPTNVSLSRFITPDTFVVFFATAAFLATVLVYQQGRTRHYVVAGICIGLAASSKYTGGLIVLPLLLANFLRHGKTAFKERNLYVALLLCGLGFLAATPFALIDLHKFLAELIFRRHVYSTGHPGMEGKRWYLNYMWHTASIIYILATLQTLRGLYSRSKEIILLSLFPVVYFVFISSFVVRNDRTFLPLTPFLFLLAGSLSAHLFSKANGLQSKALRQLSILAIACLMIAGLFQPSAMTITNTIRLTTVNSRETARIWITNNLPLGAKIAIESYSPFVEPMRFSVQGFERMIDHKPEWYIENGFEYLVFSQGMYGRFYLERERYNAEVSQYDSFFNRFALTKMFIDGSYEVRVYNVK